MAENGDHNGGLRDDKKTNGQKNSVEGGDVANLPPPGEAASSSTTTTTTSTTRPAGALNKIDRNKLKKLKKRAAQSFEFPGTLQTGLLTRAEWEEFQALMAKSGGAVDNSKTLLESNDVTCPHHNRRRRGGGGTNLGPLIRLRKRNKGELSLTDVQTEGVHHRDLLSWLLLLKNGETTTVRSKKRKRSSDEDEEKDASNGALLDDGQQESQQQQRPQGPSHPMDTAASVPFWASIHNPGTVQQIAILEIHVSRAVLDQYTLLQASSAASSEMTGDQDSTAASGTAIDAAAVAVKTSSGQLRRSKIGVATTWFHGDHPKAITDSLMYFANSGDKRHQKKSSSIMKKIMSNPPPTNAEILERLQDMVLSKEERDHEGYPSTSTTDTIPIPSHNIPKAESHEQSVDRPMKSPKDIDPSHANEFVKATGVRVNDQANVDEQPYVVTGAGNNTSNDRPCVPPPRAFAIDCEMVMTTLGLELARVTILRFDGMEKAVEKTSEGRVGRSKPVHLRTTTVLDCLVRPSNAIVDYLTRHSGITPKLLEPVTTRLAQVQYALAHYFTTCDILIGHSLENDLKALHLIHENVIDTAMLFRPRNRRCKLSLRHLTTSILKREIQMGNDGHCSEEDALAALDLAVRKAWLGDALQVAGFCGSKDRRRSLLQHPMMSSQSTAKSTAAFVGPSSWLQTHVTTHPNGAHALGYESVEDCKRATIAWLSGSRKAGLVWSNVSVPGDAKEDVEKATEFINALVKDILDAMPPTAAFVVALQADLQKSLDRHRQRRSCQDARSTLGWSTDEEEQWQVLLEGTRKGFVQWYSAIQDRC